MARSRFGDGGGGKILLLPRAPVGASPELIDLDCGAGSGAAAG